MSKANPFDLFDLSDVLTEEARQLRARAWGSARMVGWVILFGAILLVLSGNHRDAALWVAVAGGMVGVTLLYAYRIWPDGIADGQAQAYLRGHVVVSACTGLVWGGFAIYMVAGGGEAEIYVSAVFLSSITTGGAMSGTVYRPGYLALATAALIPFGTYLMVFGEGYPRAYGLFAYLYFAFCYITNEQASARTRRAIMSDLGRAASQEIIDQGVIIARLNDEKKRFMAAISHDMTQPVIAQQHLLAHLERPDATPEEISALAGIRQALNSQKYLLDELITYARLDTLAATAAPELIDTGVLLDTLCAEFTLRAEARGLTLVTRSDCATIISTRHILLRILRNLLSNAVKYADEGSAVEITMTRDASGRIAIAVANWGPEIALADRGRIFDEYVRLSDGADQPGLGLGLTITRSLVAQIEGQIALVSGGGKTVFTVSIPERPVAPAVLDEAPFVLFVGQSEDPLLGSYSEMLSIWMWRFAHADSEHGAQRLIRLMGARPDVAVLDMPRDAAPDVPIDGPAKGEAVPVPDGLAMAERIERALGIPVLTIDRSGAAITSSLSAPFSPQLLRQRIEALLV
ncbi:HAMP domain-containing sensor histidine kinase [Phaeobacter sp. HF9A]|uniref:sensor histidine kinase n=1 Tax=Phaeobacter sp. HF9A TaxID=2721561 RepID=UPI001430F68E|nr:HAMP domain-containing sensor histidine kinase [Phaeobacter sp. HF9A]NIZ11894.1 HAMP domain-containing histidine kinase [Phaeobacter sp. HF9A]